MSCLWTRRLLLGANSVLLVKHPAIAFSTFAATRSIQPPPLISLFSSRRRSLSTTTAACSPPLHPHSDIGNHIESPQSWGLNSFLFFYNHSLCFFFFLGEGRKWCRECCCCSCYSIGKPEDASERNVIYWTRSMHLSSFNFFFFWIVNFRCSFISLVAG